MKATVKSAIPLAVLRFLAASVLFMVAGATFQDHLMREKRQTRFNCRDAEISPDGALTYKAYRQDSPGVLREWAFDESLERNWEVSPPPGEERAPHKVGWASLRPVNRKEYAPWQDCVMAVNFGDRWGQVSEFAIVWWNGPRECFDLYDRVSRLRVESLGPDGKRVVAPDYPAGRFEIQGVTGVNDGLPNPAYVAAGDGIYTLSIPDMALNRVYDRPCAAMGGSFRMGRVIDNRYARGRGDLALISEDTFLVIDPEGAILRQIRLPDGLADLSDLVPYHGAISVDLLDNRMAHFTFNRSGWQKRTVALLTDDGRLVRRVDFSPNEITHRMNNSTPERRSLRFPTLMSPLPGMMTIPALIQSLGLSFVLAGIIFWRQTRIGRQGAKRVAWTIFTIATGLLGAATYFVAYRDFRTEPCPQCHRRRPVAEETCPHCRTPWPVPKPLGLEISDPA